MRFNFRSLFFSFSAVILLAVSFAMLASLAKSGRVVAAANSCRVVLAIDISGSIDSSKKQVFINQINALFSSLAALDDTSNVQLAFWTFSNSSSANFNQYTSGGYISRNVSPSEYNLSPFKTNLTNALSANSTDSGLTNYAQGFGYNPTRSGLTNSFGSPVTPGASIGNILNPQDGIKPRLAILLTDGEPNAPGLIDQSNTALGERYIDGNEAAVNAAVQAKRQFPKVAGGFINPSNTQNALLNLARVINENTNTSPTVKNIGPLILSNTQSTIYEFINENITEACGQSYTPPPPPPSQTSYNLIPSTTASTSTATSGDIISFNYTVDNDKTTTAMSNWEIYDVTIDPSVSGNPLDFKSSSSACTTTNGQPYCDSIASCSSVEALRVGVRCIIPVIGTATGRSDFSQRINSSFYSPAHQVTVGNLSPGTRICSLIRLETPTNGSERNRISSAACVTIGKLPLMQVWGGDIRVGAHFDGSSPPVGPGIYTSTFAISGNSLSKTFGSWSEYGVLATGPIKKIASLSGYSDGYTYLLGPEKPCNITSLPSINSLTFANFNTGANGNECGYFSQNSALIPDPVSALKNATNVPYNTMSLTFNAGSAPGLYEKRAGDGDVTIAASIIPKSKQFIVYAPNGKVTIAGDITYNNSDSFSVDDIESGQLPQLVIIAKNIEINVAVKQVDAWLVAQAVNGDGGIIDTCVGFTIPFSAVACKDRLRINGPVMANELRLWRTTVDMNRIACQLSTSNPCNYVGNPAEIINLSAASLLWAQNYNRANAIAQTTYTVEMPPYY